MPLAPDGLWSYTDERTGEKIYYRYNNKPLYHDKTGIHIVNFTFSKENRPFSEGLSAYRALYIHRPLWGFLDKNGKVVIKPVFQWADSFSEGLAAVAVETSRVLAKKLYGFIDKTGAYVIPLQFDNAKSFYRGYARVMQKGYLCFIDKAGKIVNEYKIDNGFDDHYPDIQEYHDGLAAIRQNGKWGYVNERGDMVIEPIFNAMFFSTSGTAYDGE